ncbi:unnamed protein product [Allacma fusca]|uniref:Uncharacterized protein n=1 Tax=Allacma fusca TaxID=39272 RepID=A0A8J2NQY7_9HEXA|nr:unnamed protein product [Allacma fusca]
MKSLLVVGLTLAFAFQFAWAAPKVELRGPASPTATPEEIIEQFEKTWAGIAVAVKDADSKLKEILSGNEILPQVEKLMFDAEFVIATLASGALNELIENPRVDQRQLVTDVLRQTGIIVVQTISDIEQVLSNIPYEIQLQVWDVFTVLLVECEAQIDPLVDLIEQN